MFASTPSYCFSIPDLNLEEAGLLVLVDVDVDWKVCIDVAHLVLVALGDTDDHVVDESADGAEGSDTLAVAMVEFNGDDTLLCERETDGQVTEVLDELACSMCECFPFFFLPFSPADPGVPRGPSTVTVLVLMWTLTVEETKSAQMFRVDQTGYPSCYVPPSGIGRVCSE